MKVLVACEESQRVCIAFRNKGHEAYSCDTQECSGGHPEWHIQGDVLPLLEQDWDLIIAHPPCTYLSNAGACRMYPTKGVIDENRLKLAMDGKKFFMKFMNCKCPKVAIENPRPLKVVGLPQETQRIQPYEYGHPFSKMTYLWLKGLPPLVPTKIIDKSLVRPYVNAGSYSSNGQRRKTTGCSFSAKDRSKTFEGIAEAMAEQWG